MPQANDHARSDPQAGPRVRLTDPIPIAGGPFNGAIPFVVGVLGDFSGRPAEPPPPLRDRRFVPIDHDEFDAAMVRIGPGLEIDRENTLVADGSRLAIRLRFRSTADFGPTGIISQVAPLARLHAVQAHLRDLLAQVDRSDVLEALLDRILVDTDAIRSLNSEWRDREGASRSPAGEEGAPGSRDVPVGLPGPRPVEDGAITLDRVAQAIRFVDSARAREMIGTLIGAVSDGFVDGGWDVSTTIRNVLSRVDEYISRQVAAILRHPDFQKLEGSWRGLAYLVANSETGPTLKIKVLDVSRRELWDDLAVSTEPDRSMIYDKVCREAFEAAGGEPFGVLIGDYEFTDLPEDVELLGKLSKIAAAASCPFIAAAAPRLFGLDSWRGLLGLRDLRPIFQDGQHAPWRALRESEDARFVALVLPRVLARLPYSSSIGPMEPEDTAFADVTEGDVPAIGGRRTLAAQGSRPATPRAFVSYSWDDEVHKEWVKLFATRLRADGVDVMLDRWHAAPGDRIPLFMERAVRESDFVIAVCTPRFKERSDGRGGGVGFEGDVITAFAFAGEDEKKIIPVLRRGAWKEAAPTWLLGRAHINLSADPYSESDYEELLRTLHGAREAPPPIGERPDFGERRRAKVHPSPPPAARPARPSRPRRQPPMSPGFAFEELDWRRRVSHEELTWMNASYLMGAVMTRAFARTGECTSISGPRSGGRLEGLFGFSCQTEDGDTVEYGPTEAVLSGRRREALSELGFLPLCHFRGTDSVVFFGGRTALKPETFLEPEATKDAEIASRLPCIMVLSRFMIGIKLMARGLANEVKDAEELVSRIRGWIEGYVDPGPDPDERRRASHPLREAGLILEPVPELSGSSALVVSLRPWLPLEELSAPVRMEVRLPLSMGGR